MDLEADEGAQSEAAPVEQTTSSGDTKSTLADKIDNSRILGGVLALTGVVVVLSVFFAEGQGLDALNLNNFNFAFLMIGLLLYLSPTKYLQEFYSLTDTSRLSAMVSPTK